ncbi:hypothetical protein CkaCkLH20_01557 [Colletotrichum karsti]|uniref:Uncharacterized protein n=1 Tax=Colletotrichum karsti TaxID=1095194 RepID=A0A9P6LP78_9PEZI|nr:uncharacterized protein CkaCkLH20_01557 [Colletotrichum karsti]KAF9880515.1 hypothetical protein CkaCkLH20_01557 [Colletotrichum karsti]
MLSQKFLWLLPVTLRAVTARPYVESSTKRDVDPWNRELQVKWDFDFQVGIGYHTIEGKVSDQSPFEQSSLSMPPIIGGGQSKFQFTIINDFSDVKHAMSVSLSAGVPVEGGTVDLSTSYTQSSDFSDTHKAAYLSISQMDQTTVLTADPQLTADATALLQNDPCQFDDQYGSYFVAGFISSRYIQALADFRATNAAEMSDFTAKISYAGPIPGAGGASNPPNIAGNNSIEGLNTVTNDQAKNMAASASLDIKTSSVEDQITLSITAESLGLKNAPSTISIDELYSLCDSFNDPDNQLPVPTIAILRSFRSLSTQAAVPGDCGPQGTATQSAALGAVQAQMFNLPKPLAEKVTAMSQDLASQLVTIAAMDSADPTKATELSQWDTQFAALKTEVAAIPQRMDFMVRVNQNFGNAQSECTDATGDQGPGCPIPYDDDQYGIISKAPYFWTWGEVTNTNMGLAIQSELQVSDDIVDRDSVSWPSRSHHSSAFGDPNKVIVGFEVFSDWQDFGNGWWRLDGLTHNSVSVQFTSDVGRDPAWRLRAWYVDASLYRFPGTY